MNQDEKLEQLLYQYAGEDVFPGRERVWQALQNVETKPVSAPRRRVNMRRAISAAIALAFLVTTTVFAEEIAQAVRQLVHGPIHVNDYATAETWDLPEEINLEDYDAYWQMMMEGGARGMDLSPEELEDLDNMQTLRFDTAGQLARQVGGQLPFEKLEFSPPEGYTLLWAEVTQLGNGRVLPEVGYIFENQIYWQCSVSMRYVGPDAVIQINRAADPSRLEEVERLEVNGCEAIYTDSMGLLWIENEVSYWVHASSREEALAFADAIALSFA